MVQTPNRNYPIPAPGANPYYDAFVAMMQAVDTDVEAVEAALLAFISTAGGEHTALGESITALEGRATTVEGRATTVEGRATALEGRATTVEGRATALEGRATTLEADVSSLASADVDVFLPIEWATDGSVPPEEAAAVTSATGVLMARAFAGDAVNDLVIPWVVPSDIDVSEGITFAVHGVISSATAPASGEGVAFKLSGFSAGLGDSINGTFGAEVASSQADLFAAGCTAQFDAFVTTVSGKVTITDLAKGEKVFLHFKRDTADTIDDYVQSVGVMGVNLTYTKG